MAVSSRFLSKRAQKYGFIFRIISGRSHQNIFDFATTFATMRKIQTKREGVQEREKGSFPNFILQKVDYDKLVVFDQPLQNLQLVDRCDFFKTYGFVYFLNLP